MSQKLYKSTICQQWPISRQDEVFAAVYYDKFPPVFQDIVKPYKRKPEFLTDRANMLRPTSRRNDDAFVTASLACLAFDADDLLCVLTAAGERGASIIDLSAGITIKPRATNGELAKAAQIFAQARMKERALERGKPGGDASGKKRSGEAKAGCALIEDKWPNPKYETADLLAEAKCVYGTAVKILGRRPIAIANFIAAQKRRAKREERANA